MAYSMRLREAVLRNPTAPAAELAAELGVTTHAIHCVKHELRKAGYDIPYAVTKARTSPVKAFIMKNPEATPEEVSKATGCVVRHAKNMIREVRREHFESEANAIKESAAIQREDPPAGGDTMTFTYMVSGFVNKVKAFMQTADIDKEKALKVLNRGHEAMKEAITNGT